MWRLLSCSLLLLFLSTQQLPLLSEAKHLAKAKNYTYVREIRPNRSPEIDSWNRYVGNALGSPYCAAFVGSMIGNTLSPNVKSGLARRYYSKSPKQYRHSAQDIIARRYTPKAGDIVVWGRGSSMFGHAGFVLHDWHGTSGWTIEANTSAGKSGSQHDGNGVHPRFRKIEIYNYFRIIGFIEVIE